MIEIDNLEIPQDLIPNDLFGLEKSADAQENVMPVVEETAQEETVSEEPAKDEVVKVKQEEPKEKKKKTKKSAPKVKEEVVEDDSPIAIPGTDITQNCLNALKEQYGKVYRSILGNTVYIWHRLSRAEFASCIQETKDIEDIDEKLLEREKAFCRAACVYPHIDKLNTIFNDNDVISTALCDEVLQYSGFARPITSEL